MNSSVFSQQLCDFIAAAPTPFHAVDQMARRLDAAGFVQLDEAQRWEVAPGGRYYATRNGSSIIAWGMGEADPLTGGLRLVGAHTDSPCLKLKPQPEVVRQGYLQLGVEVYGGALLSPWFDRDLSLAGRVVCMMHDGSLGSLLVDLKRAVAVIPSLAIHLDREVNNQRSINAQTHLPPLLLQAAGTESPSLRQLLTDYLRDEGHGVAKVLDFELALYDVQPPALVGWHKQFVAGARLDNLLSCFTGLDSLLQTDGRQTCMLICTDHEEVGSTSACGANGPFLRAVLDRLFTDASTLVRVLDRSLMISADNAHGIHPNFSDKHDAQHGPILNRGPVIKHNANQRYATNAETAGWVRWLAAQIGVPVQDFVVRTDLGCGSTIGPITASEVGVKVVDLGVPTFAMHSVRELAGAEDAWALGQLLRAFFGQATVQVRSC